MTPINENYRLETPVYFHYATYGIKELWSFSVWY